MCTVRTLCNIYITSLFPVDYFLVKFSFFVYIWKDSTTFMQDLQHIKKHTSNVPITGMNYS